MRNELKKQVGKLDILSLAVGSIIGWGAFVLPGNLFLKEAGIINTFIGLLLGAIVMIIIERNYGFMLSRYPVAGGEYAFTYKAFGRNHAFICAWFLGLAYISIVPLNATALALIGRVLFPGLLQRGFLYVIAGYEIYFGEVIVASLALIIFAYLNIKGVKIASSLQTAMTFILLGMIFLLMSIVLLKPNVNTSNMMSYMNFKNNFSISAIIKVLAIAPWAYIGFDCIPQAAEEFDFPAKKASILASISILIGFIVYNVLNFITSFAFTQEMILNSSIDWATGQAVEMLIGRLGLVFLGIALLMAIIAGINGFYMASSRVLFALARAKVLNSWFAEVDKESKIPKNAILFVMILSLLAPWFGREVLLWIVNMSSIGAAIGYLYTSLSAFKLAKIENDKKVMMTGMIGTISGIIFSMLLLIPFFESSLNLPSYVTLIIWLITGINFYKKNSKSYNNIPKSKLDMLIFGELS